MGFLNWLAWGAFGGLGIKDAYDNQKYISESKQRMVANDSLFYCDSKGRMFYRLTGEQIMQSYRNNRKVYINVRTGAVVCDLTSIDHQRYLRELSQKYRQYRVRVDKGHEVCNIDFKDWKYYELKRVPYPDKDGVYKVDACTYYRRNLALNKDYWLKPDGDWFEISDVEYKELGGINACGPRVM